MIVNTAIKAPWEHETVTALTAYQRFMHPYTYPNSPHEYEGEDAWDTGGSLIFKPKQSLVCYRRWLDVSRLPVHAGLVVPHDFTLSGASQNGTGLRVSDVTERYGYGPSPARRRRFGWWSDIFTNAAQENRAIQ